MEPEKVAAYHERTLARIVSLVNSLSSEMAKGKSTFMTRKLIEDNKEMAEKLAEMPMKKNTTYVLRN